MVTFPAENPSVTSPFLGGYRSTGGHSGTDFAGDVGDPIMAAAAGVVVESGWGGAYGNIVSIRHPDGTVTRYAHASRLLVPVGAQVGKGQVIAAVGSTGNSSGPHLHFEVRQGGLWGQTVDPMAWLDGASVETPVGVMTAEGPQMIERVVETTYEPVIDIAEDGTPQEEPVGASTGSRATAVTDEGIVGAETGSRSGYDQGATEESSGIGQIGYEETSVETFGFPAASGPEPAGMPDYSTLGGSERQIVSNAYNLIKQVGGSNEEARLLASVVIPESGGVATARNPTTVNGSNAYGLWQIMFPLHSGRAGVTSVNQLFDPLTNARVALSIYRDQGLGAWEVTRLDGGRHRQYLL